MATVEAPVTPVAAAAPDVPIDGDVIQSVEGTPRPHDELPDCKPAPVTPPTSEDMDKRDHRMSSELSELESSDDDEDIEPDHYFEGGKIPVFKPTMDQFRNFKKFIDKVDKYGMKSGIVKVVPPKEWIDSLPNLSEAVKTIKVKNPIMQEFAGQHGIYTQANIEKQRSYNLPEWRTLTDEPHHQPPARRGERRRAAEAAPRTRSTRAQPSATGSDDTPRRGPGRPRRRPMKTKTKEEEDDAEMEVPPTPKSPGKEEEDKKKRSRTRVKKEDASEDTPSKARGRQPKSTTSRRMNNRAAYADYVDEEAFKDFDYHLPGLEEFTIERCKELEDNYWKTINYGQPMYGADMPGSLFDDRTTSWNVAKLPNLLDVLGTKVPGVNTAYLYLGMWKATFAWHLEDVDLYSINYIHFGAPKQWYSISQEDARRFEAAMKSIWPRDAKNCSQFLRHKTYLISPAQLEKQFNIKVNRLVHYEGEFVITYPYGYHSGYNLGYNCAESVNFANESWLSYGRIAKKCECESDSVWVDVNEIERKLRGEPTPEYYEETDDEDEEEAEHLPSPPRSVAGKNKKKAGRKPANKRKRGEDDAKEAPKSKRMKRIRIRIKIPGRGMPCVLCPNDVDYDELLPTDNGLKAHRLCADYTPETYISPQGIVCNVSNIGKDRLDLKCNYCRSKRGAVFQCSQKKCTRAFHATCAAPAGVQVDLGPMPTFDEEGTEYFYDGYDFRCRFHRPKKRNLKKVTVDTLEQDKFVYNYARKLKPQDVVQFQYLDTEMYQVYGAMVIENRPAEEALLVEVLPDGDRIEVEWKYLLALDPADSERPKPSANAKPLPEHLKENDSSLAITNRTDGVPSEGDPFHDPDSSQKWQEFHTAPDMTRKQAKVDLSMPNQLWYYLGKSSTEARPQYTDDPAKPVNNPKSNFLDTVKPPPPPMLPMDRRVYPMSYQMKPAAGSYSSRPMIQPNQQPTIKPYQYKPKVPPLQPTPSQLYNYAPDSRKNPNSPVGHQPNVVYDHRAAAQQQTQTQSQPTAYHQHRPTTQMFHHYTPPQSSSTGWKPPNTPGQMLQGIEQYAAGTRPLQPTPYQYHPPPAGTPKAYSPYAYGQMQGPASGPQHSPPNAATAGAQTPTSGAKTPLTNILAKPTGTSNTPMYAHTPPYPAPSTHQATTQSEYLAYVTKYPYLKNAFLRRAQTYVSPYSPNGGFSQEWIPKPAAPVTASTNGIPPRPPYSSYKPVAPAPGAAPSSAQGAPPAPGGYMHNGGPPANLAPPRPMPTFQSEDAFRQEMARTPTSQHQVGITPRFEAMMKQLKSSAPSAPSPVTGNTVPGSGPQQPPPVMPTFHHRYVQPGLPSPKHPEYSPITEAGSGNTSSAPSNPPSAPASVPQTPTVAPAAAQPEQPGKPEQPEQPAQPPASMQGSPAEAASTTPPEAPAAASQPQQVPPVHTGETWKFLGGPSKAE